MYILYYRSKATNMTTVILIRHIEKLNWAKGEQPSKEVEKEFVDNHYPSDKGYERADALVSYFTKRDEMQALFAKRPLTGLVAQDADPTGKSAQSLRPKLTLIPLSKALPDIPFALFIKSDILDAVAYIKSNDFIGKSVIVCWEHDDLTNVVSLLSDKKVVPDWPGKRYDVTWILDTETMNFTQIPQKLLFGDSDKIDKKKSKK